MALTVDHYTTDQTSWLFDGYLTYVPPVRPAFIPDRTIVVTSTGSATLVNGELIVRASSAADSKILKVKVKNVHADSVKGLNSRPNTAQSFVITIGAIDTMANPKGIQSIHISYSGNREIEPFYDHEYGHVFDPALNYTTAQRASDLVTRINKDPNRRFNANILAGAGNTSKIVLTAIDVAKNYQVTVGYPTMTMVETQAQREFGTSNWFTQTVGPSLDGTVNMPNSTYKVIVFAGAVRSANMNYGQANGGRANYYQYGFEDKGYALIFATGSDSVITDVTTVLKGTFVPTVEYISVVDDVVFE